jgi:hypothetical protein
VRLNKAKDEEINEWEAIINQDTGDKLSAPQTKYEKIVASWGLDVNATGRRMEPYI